MSEFCVGTALQCYQCDSNEDASCPSWQPFDVNINALIDCMSFEASTPGTFCMKITRESPGCTLKFFCCFRACCANVLCLVVFLSTGLFCYLSLSAVVRQHLPKVLLKPVGSLVFRLMIDVLQIYYRVYQ